MATSVQDLNADHSSCAAWIARFLKARGVDRIFGLQGGHIQPIWDHAAQLGVRIVDVRHEAAAVHMAHAHAELTGELGVAMVTAGPGVTNTVTAVANASLARAPVLADWWLHLARAGQYGPTAGHPPCRNPAACNAAVAHPSCRRPVNPRIRRGRRPRVWRSWRTRSSLPRNPHRRLTRPCPSEPRPRGVDAAEEAAHDPTRRRNHCAGGGSALVGEAAACRHRPRRSRRRPGNRPASSTRSAPSISIRRRVAASCRQIIQRSSAPCEPRR